MNVTDGRSRTEPGRSGVSPRTGDGEPRPGPVRCKLCLDAAAVYDNDEPLNDEPLCVRHWRLRYPERER